MCDLVTIGGLHLPVWLRSNVMTSGGDWWVSGRHAMSCLWQRSDTGEIPHVVTVRDLWWVMLGGVDRGAGNSVTHHHTGHCVVWECDNGVRVTWAHSPVLTPLWSHTTINITADWPFWHLSLGCQSQCQIWAGGPSLRDDTRYSDRHNTAREPSRDY